MDKSPQNFSRYIKQGTLISKISEDDEKPAETAQKASPIDEKRRNKNSGENFKKVN